MNVEAIMKDDHKMMRDELKMMAPCNYKRTREYSPAECG
jgi:hypothetical protein